MSVSCRNPAKHLGQMRSCIFQAKITVLWATVHITSRINLLPRLLQLQTDTHLQVDPVPLALHNCLYLVPARQHARHTHCLGKQQQRHWAQHSVPEHSLAMCKHLQVAKQSASIYYRDLRML